MASQLPPNRGNVIYLIPTLYKVLDHRKMMHVQAFLEDPSDSSNYPLMAAFLSSVASSYGVRVLLTMPDCHVAFDSAKLNNTHANFLAKNINENHSGRHEILRAMFKDGRGTAKRYSSTERVLVQYLAKRLGPNPEDCHGCLRLSANAK